MRGSNEYKIRVWDRLAVKTLVIIAVAAFLTTTERAQQPASEPQQPTTTGNASLGKQMYLDYSCWACHGYNAQTGNGPRLLPPRFTERQFTLYLRTPRTRQMPAYTAKVLSDADVAHIYAYILSLPREPQLKDVPLLTQLPK